MCDVCVCDLLSLSSGRMWCNVCVLWCVMCVCVCVCVPWQDVVEFGAAGVAPGDGAVVPGVAAGYRVAMVTVAALPVVLLPPGL